MDVEEPQLWHKGGTRKGFAGWDVHISTGGGAGCTYMYSYILTGCWKVRTCILCAYYLLLELEFMDVVIFLICRFSLVIDKHFLVWGAIGLE